jgi:hypothetical protein
MLRGTRIIEGKEAERFIGVTQALRRLLHRRSL